MKRLCTDCGNRMQLPFVTIQFFDTNGKNCWTQFRFKFRQIQQVQKIVETVKINSPNLNNLTLEKYHETYVYSTQLSEQIEQPVNSNRIDRLKYLSKCQEITKHNNQTDGEL